MPYEDFVSELDASLTEARRLYKSNKLYQHVINQTITLEIYKQLLIETYHFVKFTVPHLELAADLLKKDNPDLADEFQHHAKEETGHEVWALNDLKALGVDTDAVINGTPLPHTTALIAQKYFTIKEINPMAIVGLEYTMEGETAQGGEQLLNIIKKTLDLSDDAMSFFIKHIIVDSGHVEDDKKLLNHYVKSGKDKQDVIRNAVESLILYGAMYDGIVQACSNP